MDMPIVSVICITYNHEKFIADALDGFVKQITDFPFEVIVHDDASNDKTAQIIREYHKAYPSIFKPIYQVENQYSRGRGIVTRTCFSAAKGKYIALCEGDDYWTDPLTPMICESVRSLFASAPAIFSRSFVPA